VQTLPPRPSATEVFAAWATYSLIGEGLLPGEPQRPVQPPPSDSQPEHGSAEQASTEQPAETSPVPEDAEAREKLIARVRKLFAMAQETEASPHEAEIALRRCQSLMTKFGISESDLETSEFGRQTTYTGKRVPMHNTILSMAVANMHDLLYVSGGGEPANFRGYEVDVRVACLTLDYLVDAVERALTARRRKGDFPAGRMASYDYRVAFADEVSDRIAVIVNERKAREQKASPSGTSLTVRKREIVDRECGQDLVSSTVRARSAVNEAAANAGREDGSRVSLDPQVERPAARVLITET